MTTGTVEIQRLLGAPACARLELQLEVVASSRAALGRARLVTPALAILDADRPGVNGCQLSRRLKAESTLRDCRVLLVWHRPVNSADLKRAAQARCDDLVVLPLAAEEFFCHLADLLGVARRRSFRVTVELRAHVAGSGFAVAGEVENLSLHGALVRLERPGGAGETARVRLARPQGGTVAEVDARIVSRRDGGLLLGLEFLAPSPAVQAQLETLGLWQISEEDGLQRVYLEGDLVETTELTALAQRLSGRVDFAGAGVRHINSGGAHVWVRFLQSLTAVEEYTFSRCSVSFTTYASMVLGFLGRGRVVSFMAPYRCDRCEREELRLLQTSAVVHEDGTWAAPRFECARCRGTLTFDEIPERYFKLLRRR